MHFNCPLDVNPPPRSQQVAQNFSRISLAASSLLCLFTPVAEMLQQERLKGVDGRAG